MPKQPDPPVFHGEVGKDNLDAYMHDLTAWYYGVISTCNTTSARLFQVIAYKAFPFDSPAFLWFDENKRQIEGKASAEGAGEDAYLRVTLDEIESRFGYLRGSKRKELETVVLKVGEDVAAFSMRFKRLAKEAKVDEEEAKAHLLRAVTKNCPGLAGRLEHLLIDGTASLEMCTNTAQRYMVHQARMEDLAGRVPGSQLPRHAHGIDDEPMGRKDVAQIMQQVRALAEHLQQGKQFEPAMSQGMYGGQSRESASA